MTDREQTQILRGFDSDVLEDTVNRIIARDGEFGRMDLVLQRAVAGTENWMDDMSIGSVESLDDLDFGDLDD